MHDNLKNGQAFLCKKTVLHTTGDPKKIGTVSFTAGKLYFISMGCYLKDNKGITKNYVWFKDNFERSPGDDKVVVKKKFVKKKVSL
jgi:hypothetical protein